MFRPILHYPQEELLSLAQNYLVSVMLLLWLQHMFHMWVVHRYLQLLDAL